MATQDHINEQLKVLLAEDLKATSRAMPHSCFGLVCMPKALTDLTLAH